MNALGWLLVSVLGTTTVFATGSVLLLVLLRLLEERRDVEDTRRQRVAQQSRQGWRR